MNVTVTTTEASVQSLCQLLSQNDMTVVPLNLHGRFHSTANQEAASRLLEFCESRPELHFPTTLEPLFGLRSNIDSELVTRGPFHSLAVETIMLKHSNWYLTVSQATSNIVNVSNPTVLSLGLVKTIPSALMRRSNLKVVNVTNSRLSDSKLIGNESSPVSQVTVSESSYSLNSPDLERKVAVVGMGCKFPGADSIEEFWQLLDSGTSMLQEIPDDRFTARGLRRSGDRLRFWGNFVHDTAAFDHRFFKKTSREAESMDPQQRLLLQVAYQTLESAGYFGNLGNMTTQGSNDIGCYLGVCASDYNDNVASHSPTAFSSLGTLRAFLSGKISHFFGFTGPSIVYDTACSSSAVAIDAACKAIVAGECSQALAGGASIYTSPNFYQNLAAASFLSPTGASKPFDAAADGYCRGEGVGLVLLKRLSAAIADGDTIHGVINSSAVNQSHNSTPITVPHSQSQVELYGHVSALAGISPHDVSYVEVSSRCCGFWENLVLTPILTSPLSI